MNNGIWSIKEASAIVLRAAKYNFLTSPRNDNWDGKMPEFVKELTPILKGKRTPKAIEMCVNQFRMVHSGDRFYMDREKPLVLTKAKQKAYDLFIAKA